MPSCEECGGSDFYLTDGLYFCVSCNLQSQDIVEEEMETFFAVTSSVGLAQHKEVHGMLEMGVMGTQSRMESEKSIEPVGTFHILRQILEKQVNFYCQKLQDEKVEAFKHWSETIWDMYESKCKEYVNVTYSNEKEKFVTLREFMYNTHSKHFYLLYEFEHYLVRAKRLKQRIKKKATRKRKNQEAGAEKGEETLNEAVGSVDVEGYLSPKNGDDVECGSEKSATQAGDQEELTEFLDDEVCVDLELDDNTSPLTNEADTGSVKNAPAESSVHVVKEDDRQLRLFYSVEEMGIFREMLGWLSSHFPPNSTCRTPSKRTEINRVLTRPSPLACLSTLYLAATLARTPLSDVLFICNMVKDIVHNKLLFLDFTHALPSVVLTKHELAFWISLDFCHLPRRIRKTSFILYKLLGQRSTTLLSRSAGLNTEGVLIKHCCEKALELLNLPLSLSSVCARLMQIFHAKLLKWRDNRLDHSSMSSNLFRFDVFIFVSVYFMKKIVIDCCVHKKVKQIALKWSQWAHSVLLNSSKVPSYFFLLGDNSKLHDDSNYADVVRLTYFVNLLKNNNFSAYFAKLGGLPRNPRKKEKLKKLVSNAEVTTEASANNEGESKFQVLEPEQVKDAGKVIAADLLYEPDLRQVAIKLDEVSVLRNFFRQCRKFKTSVDIQRLQWEHSSLDTALFEWQLNNWNKNTSTACHKDTTRGGARETNSGAENIDDGDLHLDKSPRAKGPAKSQSTSFTIAQKFSFNKGNKNNLRGHLSKICHHFSTHSVVSEDQDPLECASEAKSCFSLSDEIFCIFSACGGSEFRTHLSVFISMFRETYGSADEL